MSTPGDVTDINPVIHFLPYKLRSIVVTTYRILFGSCDESCSKGDTCNDAWQNFISENHRGSRSGDRGVKLFQWENTLVQRLLVRECFLSRDPPLTLQYVRVQAFLTTIWGDIRKWMVDEIALFCTSSSVANTIWLPYFWRFYYRIDVCCVTGGSYIVGRKVWAFLYLFI